ncbi:MAG: DUF47 family protein [Clostridia bacterium]|nr:DUF47 family protein [Clostridia bacterium]
MFFQKGKQIDELINTHMNSVKECKYTFEEFISEVFNEGPDARLEALVKKISRLESDADEHRHESIKNLLNGSLLPDTRREMLKIVDGIDRIANDIEEISKEIYLQKMKFPKEFHDQILDVEKKEQEQLELLCKVIDNLLLNTNKYEDNIDMIKEIRSLESDIDDIEFAMIKELYDMKYELAYKNQVRVAISSIADISDLIENISDLLEIIISTRRV